MMPTPTPAPPMPIQAIPAPIYFAAVGSMRILLLKAEWLVANPLKNRELLSANNFDQGLFSLHSKICAVTPHNDGARFRAEGCLIAVWNEKVLARLDFRNGCRNNHDDPDIG